MIKQIFVTYDSLEKFHLRDTRNTIQNRKQKFEKIFKVNFQPTDKSCFLSTLYIRVSK